MIEYDKLDDNVKFILELLKQNGQGVLVGGAVRDLLLNLKPKDYDFATDISYDKLKKIFRNYYPMEIGKNFGILQIKIGKIEYQIAKFRTDIGTPQNRKKQEIKFISDLLTDLQRRDFTINAIAYDGYNLIYGNEWCKYDIENKILRFMGNPMCRINEDPLRLFRGIRFACTKNLNYKHLLELSNENFDVVETLSYERIKDEFNKIIVSDSVEVAFELFEKLKLWKYLEPKIEEIIILNKKNSYGAREYSEIISLIKVAEKDKHLRLVCFLQNIGGISGRIFLKKLNYSKESINIVTKLMDNYYPGISFNSPVIVKKIIKNIGHENIKKYISLIKANVRAGKIDFSTLEQFKKYYNEICNNKEPMELKDLKITGKDLKEIGIEGKMIGENLEYLLSLVLENPNLNTKEKLLELCKEKLNYKKVL